MKRYLFITFLLSSFLSSASYSSFQDDEDVKRILAGINPNFHPALKNNMRNAFNKDLALLALNSGIQDLREDGFQVDIAPVPRPVPISTPVPAIRVIASSSSSSAAAVDLWSKDALSVELGKRGIHDRDRAAMIRMIQSSDRNQNLNDLLDTYAPRQAPRVDWFFPPIDAMPSIPLGVRQSAIQHINILNTVDLNDGMDVHGFNRVIAASAQQLITLDRDNRVTKRDVIHGDILARMLQGDETKNIPSLPAAVTQLQGYIAGGDREGEINLPISELLERAYDLASRLESTGRLFGVAGSDPMKPRVFLAHKIAENVTGGGGCIQGHAGRLAHLYLTFFGAYLSSMN